MKRILFYCLSLRGTGHFRRMSLLASRLAEQHEVIMLDGGRPIVSQIPVPGISILELPRIWRTADDIVAPQQPAATISDVVAARREQLQLYCRQEPADVIVVEHFPFSKWFIHDDVVPMLQLVRQINQQAKFVCSVRDLLPPRSETPSSESREDRTLRVLQDYFDCLLIHSDPQFIRLEDELPWLSRLRIPAYYTGVVCQQPVSAAGPAALPGPERNTAAAGCSGVLVSAGGDGGELLRRCSIEAWRLLPDSLVADLGRQTIVLPPDPDEREIRQLQQAARGLPITIERFTPQFFSWLQQSRLSISQAGYNTCSDLLATRKRSILVPHHAAVDQPLRARRFAESGLATALAQQELSGPRLAEAIRHALSLPAPQHELNLNGAQRSCELINQLLEQ